MLAYLALSCNWDKPPPSLTHSPSAALLYAQIAAFLYRHVSRNSGMSIRDAHCPAAPVQMHDDTPGRCAFFPRAVLREIYECAAFARVARLNRCAKAIAPVRAQVNGNGHEEERGVHRRSHYALIETRRHLEMWYARAGTQSRSSADRCTGVPSVACGSSWSSRVREFIARSTVWDTF